MEGRVKTRIPKFMVAYSRAAIKPNTWRLPTTTLISLTVVVNLPNWTDRICRGGLRIGHREH